MKNIFLLTVVCLFLFSCKDKAVSKDIKIPSNIPKIDTISYDLKSISKEFGDCGESPENCATAKVQYVFLKNQATNSAYQTINSTLLQTINGNAPSLEASLDSFINEAKIFYKDFPESPAGYVMELKQSVIFNSPEIITVEAFNYSYTGGAHGNYSTLFYNFDITIGAEIDLKKVLVANYESALKAIAEPIFKKAYLEEGMTRYSEAGFYFDNDVFTLTDNFAITKEGLKFLYNPYEVAPYALGQQELVIPYTSLKDLIKQDGVLTNF